MSSFLPAKKNFPWWRDSTFRYPFEWKDEILVEGKPTVRSHDLTGYTGVCVLNPLPGEPGEPLELNTINGGVIFGGHIFKEPRNGLIELYIAKAQLESVLWKKANYTLYATEPETPNDSYALLSGRFTEAGPPL